MEGVLLFDSEELINYTDGNKVSPENFRQSKLFSVLQPSYIYVLYILGIRVVCIARSHRSCIYTQRARS